jgi:hypothetical protein
MPERKAWRAMIARCGNPNAVGYGYYGGRGIRVSTEWLGDDGFNRFLAHIGRRPTADHSVDRIDNDRGYEPGNVRWATEKEQQRNKRSNRLVTHAGKTQCIGAWAEELGVNVYRLRERLMRGWPMDEAINPTLRRERKRAISAVERGAMTSDVEGMINGLEGGDV